jgi:hypothetical protein
MKERLARQNAVEATLLPHPRSGQRRLVEIRT